MFHLLLGNMLIALFEGWILARLGAPFKKATILMMVANYFSAGLGAYMLRKLPSPDVDIYGAGSWIVLLMCGAFFLTLLVEWPLAALAFRNTKQHGVRSFLPHFCAQACSYSLLLAFYALVSPATLLRGPALVRGSQIVHPAGTTVYFISADNSWVQEMVLGVGEARRLYDLRGHKRLNRLAAVTNSPDGWSLVGQVESGSADGAILTIRSNLPGRIAAKPSELSGAKLEPTRFNFGPIPRFNTNSAWVVQTGFWPANGLVAIDRMRNVQRRIALETPFLAWPVRNATQLPTDQVIFQLGEDQICIYHLRQNKLALLTRGRGPVVSAEE